MQTSVEVDGYDISGTLHKLTSGSLVDTWGEGYFLALKWSDIDANATSLKVGLDPSEGSGLIECLSDTDRNGVFKITNPATQKFKMVLERSGMESLTVEYDLTGLELED